MGEDGTADDAPALPPAPAVEAWLDHLRIERRRSAHTVDSYSRDLDHLRRFAAGLGRELAALDRHDLEAFVRELMGRGLHRAEEPIRRLSLEIVEQLQAVAGRG